MLGGRIAQYSDTYTPCTERSLNLPAGRKQSVQWKIYDFP